MIFEDLRKTVSTENINLDNFYGATTELNKSKSPEMNKKYIEVPPRGSCYNCREDGHTFRECPYPRKMKYCHWCGRQGVVIEDCPNCSSKYKHQSRFQTVKSNNDYGNYNDFDGVIIDDTKSSYFSVDHNDHIKKFLDLLHAIKHLSIETQENVINLIIDEKRQVMREKCI